LIAKGKDPRKFIKVSGSIKEYLEQHINKLKSNWYMNERNRIESYCLNPTDAGANGSITKTNGIVITAHANFNFMISIFNSVGNEN
jgi:hypothetical protein